MHLHHLEGRRAAQEWSARFEETADPPTPRSVERVEAFSWLWFCSPHGDTRLRGASARQAALWLQHVPAQQGRCCRGTETEKAFAAANAFSLRARVSWKFSNLKAGVGRTRPAASRLQFSEREIAELTDHFKRNIIADHGQYRKAA